MTRKPRRMERDLYRFAFLISWAACLAIAFPVVAAPRNAGHPNITGVWERFPDPFADDAAVFKDLPPPNEGPNLKEPYATQWKTQREKRAAALQAGTPLVDASTLCLPEGMPTIMGAIFPIQILQTPGQVTVLAEFLTQTRRIYLDEKMPDAGAIAPSYYGFSAGRWEGDTLVVTTRGIQKSVQFFEIPHSEDMTIRERLRLTAPNMFEDSVTIEDPEFLREPYKFTFGYRRNDQYRIAEYICDHKDNFIIGPDGTVSVKLDPTASH